jgi:hypothetical protein
VSGYTCFPLRGLILITQWARNNLGSFLRAISCLRCFDQISGWPWLRQNLMFACRHLKMFFNHLFTISRRLQGMYYLKLRVLLISWSMKKCGIPHTSPPSHIIIAASDLILDERMVETNSNRRSRSDLGHDCECTALHRSRMFRWKPTSVVAISACPAAPMIAVGYETGDLELWDLAIMSCIQVKLSSRIH